MTEDIAIFLFLDIFSFDTMLAGYSASNKSTTAEYPARFRMLGAFAGLGKQWLIPPTKIVKDGTTWLLQQL